MSLAGLVHDPLTRFIAQIGAIIALSRALGLVARRIGQPIVIAETMAGILLGPSLLGFISPEATAILFAPQSLGALELVSQLGLVLFMFLIGLELDTKPLRGLGKAPVAVAQVGIVFPFALGAAAAALLHTQLASHPVSVFAFASFLGVAMCVTAFPVLARILSERGLIRSRVGTVTIAAAAINDVTAWCLLAFVVAIIRARGLEAAGLTTIAAIGYVTLMFVVVRPLLTRIASRVANREGLGHDVVAGIMLLLFASSWATELIGIHALFGAFLMGAILPKEGGLAQALAEKLEDLVLVILLPVFFAYSGLRTEIGLLDSWAAWAMCSLLVVVACAGKVFGCSLAARLTGLPWREAGAVGILMNTRGLMALIVLNIGLDLGIISSTVFTMMVVVALATTFLTMPALNALYPPGQLAAEMVGAASVPAPTVAPAAAQNAIMVCVADDRSGPGLVSMAAALRGQADGPVHALHLLTESERASARMRPRAHDQHDGALEPLLANARALAVDVRPMAFESSAPAEDICRIAQAKATDLVLLGWHKPILSQSFLGGTVHRVMRDAHCDVAVFVDRGLRSVSRVLVPFIGTAHDYAALAIARRLSQAGADVTLLHVKGTDEAPTRPRSTTRRAADEMFREADGHVSVRVVYADAPVDVAVAESWNGFDLVVVGVGPNWGLERRLLGIYPERLMKSSPASLLIVRGRPSAAAERMAHGAVRTAVVT